ncbi:hypothetical protein EBB59_07035 [Lysobacter pythonis]|uniref:Uncharacterized protein n=2 Tax=Solilutibacter pythonis TaxID=2483112 RepID=A0A3M2HYQ9_9GAMM|nr:hypothetical protein EBB59_07035 [Lysobacter pythonis]
MAGFSFGVIRPALASGRWHELPIHSIWLGGLIMTAIIAVCARFLLRWYRQPHPDALLDEDNW